jgi:hypothetical protein
VARTIATSAGRLSPGLVLHRLACLCRTNARYRPHPSVLTTLLPFTEDLSPTRARPMASDCRQSHLLRSSRLALGGIRTPTKRVGHRFRGRPAPPAQDSLAAVRRQVIRNRTPSICVGRVYVWDRVSRVLTPVLVNFPISHAERSGTPFAPHRDRPALSRRPDFPHGGTP